MNNRPTPETDAAASPHIGFYSCATVTANFARRLEIERDEAWEQNAKLSNSRGREMSDRPTPDIQAELEMWRDGNIMHQIHREELEKTERERDEAREELYDIRLNLGEDAEGYTMIHAVCVLQQERDEAREQAHRFRALHYSHLGINASASWFPWEEKLGHE